MNLVKLAIAEMLNKLLITIESSWFIKLDNCVGHVFKRLAQVSVFKSKHSLGFTSVNLEALVQKREQVF